MGSHAGSGTRTIEIEKNKGGQVKWGKSEREIKSQNRQMEIKKIKAEANGKKKQDEHLL